ncbi:MAG: M43 family zinc metalloprotease [Bacteroidota bacterium]
MKRFKNRLNLLIFSVLVSFSCFSQLIERRCATAEIEKQRLQKNIEYSKKRTAFNQSINQYLVHKRASNSRKSAINELIRIPVVVHVIHNNLTNTIGGSKNSNISAEQIKSQIEVLNEDYRKKPNSPGFNSNPIGVDMDIEFFLAELDPDGNPTTGITRTFNEKSTFDPFNNDDQALLSELSYWPSDCYLNIWTTALSNNYLGFSQFPSAPNFDGLDTESDEKVDGVYIDFKYFGRKTGAISSKYYKFGRTTTHEIGHWLGLIHTWGDENCGDDYVDDTPESEGPNLTVVCTELFSRCSGTRTRNMIENYLDYTVDSCMNVFTIGQKERVKAVFELSPRRKKLVECVTSLPESEQLDLQITPNPVTDYLKGNLLLKGTADAEIIVFDRIGNEIARQFFQDKRSFVFSIPIYDLPRGVYLIKAIAQGQTVTKRILLN